MWCFETLSPPSSAVLPSSPLRVYILNVMCYSCPKVTTKAALLFAVNRNSFGNVQKYPYIKFLFSGN
jgi:hypothetical protein